MLVHHHVGRQGEHQFDAAGQLVRALDAVFFGSHGLPFVDDLAPQEHRRGIGAAVLGLEHLLGLVMAVWCNGAACPAAGNTDVARHGAERRDGADRVLADKRTLNA